ncbi:ABC transporter permease [Deinococcus sp.]|uniref:ABC transporter permease n=1 Tax=Deinococcus sp. TaxID=47478 RepID=UPI003C7C5293
MALLALWHLASRGLKVRPLRSWLTVLSVAVAAASLTAFLSLGAGLRQAVAAQIGSIGPQLQLSGADLLQSFSPPPTLHEGLAWRVRALGPRLGLSSVTPVLLGYQGEGAAQVTLYGVPAGLQAIFPGVRVAAGRMLNAADQGRPVVVLGAAVAIKGGLLVGQTVQVKKRPMRVVGVMAPTGTLTDGFLVVPLDVLQSAMRVSGMISLVAVQVASEEAVPQVATRLAQTFELEAQTQSDFRAVTRRLLTISGLVQTVLGLVALLIGALSVLNTVSMSVLERRAEFATLRALGARPGWLLRLVLTESLLLSLLGGVIGLSLGGGAALGVSAVTGRAVGVRAALLTPGVALEVLLACLLTGLLAGLPTAWRSGRRSIVVGLAVR